MTMMITQIANLAAQGNLAAATTIRQRQPAKMAIGSRRMVGHPVAVVPDKLIINHVGRRKEMKGRRGQPKERRSSYIKNIVDFFCSLSILLYLMEHPTYVDVIKSNLLLIFI
jgi:hypothetical protein